METWATDFVVSKMSSEIKFNFIDDLMDHYRIFVVQLPACVWLAGFFNPQSLLTAIMQSTARKNELPLDKMCLVCDVTKKQKEDFT